MIRVNVVIFRTNSKIQMYFPKQQQQKQQQQEQQQQQQQQKQQEK